MSYRSAGDAIIVSGNQIDQQLLQLLKDRGLELLDPSLLHGKVGIFRLYEQ